MLKEELKNVHSNKKRERRYDIDWLRIFALITIFFFHCARFFDYEDWHIKNSQLSFGMTLFVTFVVQWIMPLFFVLSGESAFFSLQHRKGWQYVRERFQRLIIPFMFGMFVLAPPQIYLERVSKGEFAGSFIQFYPHYFDGLYGYGGNFAWMGLHLWYLLFLFVFSMLTLPFFLYLKKETKHHLTLKVTTFFEKPGTIFLLAIPLAIILILTDCLLFNPDGLLSEWSGFVYFGGWNLFIYLILFIYGYILASYEQFKEIIKKHGKTAMVLGVILSLLLFLPLTAWNVYFLDYPFGFALLSILDAFHSWFWIIAILSLGSVHLSFNSRWLKDANEVALPFYVLHQPVIVIIGFFVVNMKLSVSVKYLLISTSALICTVFLLLIISRIDLLRFFFGMKLKRQTRA